jgi:hypothetical protein
MKIGPITRFCRTLPFLALLAACGGFSISIFLGTVDRSSYSGIGTFRVAVVNDHASWAALWAAHTASQGPVPMLPPIDFSSRMVVGVFLGPRPNGCYAVRIEDIYTTSDRAVVRFSERYPGLDEICTQAITTPAHIVTVSRTGLAFEFVKTN